MRKWIPFKRGAIAGMIPLILGFALRIGGFAPYPPEAGIELLIRYIPASIEQPAIQTFGDAAIQLGLLIASIVALLGYGLFGLFFEGVFAPRAASLRILSQFEKFLAYAFVPWAFFGLIFLPATGFGFFGLSSPNGTLLYPFSLLLIQSVFCWVLSFEYKGEANVFLSLSIERVDLAETKMERETEEGPRGDTRFRRDRRSFIEKSILAGSGLFLTIFSLGNLLSFFGSGGISDAIRPGQPYNSGNAPAIFSDPRLAQLVDSEITANNSFYRVDIDLTPPPIAASSWSLIVDGTVSPKSYSLADLQALPQVEQYTTFECVSNVVNGNLISTTKWSGVKILTLLQNAGGLPASAAYLVFYSVDGYSVGIPVSKATTDHSLLAFKMNNLDLPAEHGYPLRAVIPGLYGMMSAKWITKIEVVDSVYQGYWQTRGYTNDATIHTLAFIRVPRDNEVVSLSQQNGSVMLGGYAFAGDRGISKVEVSTDGGQNWKQATLKSPISNLTWTLWAFDWHPASAGTYQVYARATDGGGQTQIPGSAPPYPNGATGYVVMTVNVGA